MHIRTIPAGGRLRRAVPNSSPIRKSVWDFGGGPPGGEGGGGAGASAIRWDLIVLGTTGRVAAITRLDRVFAYTFHERGFAGHDFGYLVQGDGCCHDAGDFFWR